MSVSGSLIDLLVCICLFWILVRIPFWAKDMVLSGPPAMVTQVARSYVLGRTLRGSCEPSSDDVDRVRAAREHRTGRQDRLRADRPPATILAATALGRLRRLLARHVGAAGAGRRSRLRHRWSLRRRAAGVRAPRRPARRPARARRASGFVLRPRLRLLAPEGIPPTAARRTAGPAESRSTCRCAACAALGAGRARGGRVLSCCCARRATGFALRSDEEQQALVEAFGRFLNGLTDPIQIAVRSEPVDLDALGAAVIDQAAGGQPHPALGERRQRMRGSCRARQRPEVRRREIVLILTATGATVTRHRAELERRASETIDLLQAAGVELQPLTATRRRRCSRALARPARARRTGSYARTG